MGIAGAAPVGLHPPDLVVGPTEIHVAVGGDKHIGVRLEPSGIARVGSVGLHPPDLVVGPAEIHVAVGSDKHIRLRPGLHPPDLVVGPAEIHVAVGGDKHIRLRLEAVGIGAPILDCLLVDDQRLGVNLIVEHHCSEETELRRADIRRCQRLLGGIPARPLRVVVIGNDIRIAG